MAGLVGIYHLFELTASRIFGTGKAIVRKYLLKYNRSLRAVVLILFVCRRSFFFPEPQILMFGTTNTTLDIFFSYKFGQGNVLPDAVQGVI